MKRLVLSAMLALILSLGACAGKERTGVAVDVPTYSPAAEVIGMRVVDIQGQPVGQLENIVADWETGRIGYGVVSIDGNPYLLPWSAISISAAEPSVLRLNVDRQKVVTGPRFQRGTPISQATTIQIHQHYGISPIWEEKVRERPRPGTPAITDPSYPTGNIPSTGIPGR
ncbi:MAG: PRC-barrel domain-containing protein [Desulfuromonadales bacterium]|nr:PRC-barrel domain-containing protein [Desulfuromonadales bacterium]